MRMKWLSGIAAGSAIAAAAGCGSAGAAEAERAVFGELADGTAIESVTLANVHGVSARVISYGATLQSLILPDRNGRSDDVALGYSDLDGYVAHPQFFGATVGRYANRIAGARFVLDGRTFELPRNDGPNSLHGGSQGFDKRNWTIDAVENGPTASVKLSLISNDGDQGYPGTLRVSIVYSLDDDNVLTTIYEAQTDKSTIVNLTHHSLFNLAGVESGRSVLGQLLTVNADAFTPVDAALIPTGELIPVAGTPFDFTTPQEIGAGIRDATHPQILIGRGYDHNFVLRGGLTREPKPAATLEDPVTGRRMELFTTEPGVQVYSGNFLNGTIAGKGGVAYRQGDGLALEPQKFPDSPNQPAFPSARLDPGETYRQVSLYRFSVH